MAIVGKRRGMITNTEGREDIYILTATIPLSKTFGFATELRGLTSGIGEFNLEYLHHAPVPPNEL